MAYKTGTATDYVDLLDKLVAFALAKEIDSVAIAAGGAGYSPGDVLTLSGGTAETASTLTVATVDGGGAVTGVTITTRGLYCNGSEPANPVATTVAPAGGAGCTINVTWRAALGYTERRNSVYSAPDKEVILEGTGGGATTFWVGIRTLRDVGAGAYNWELAGMTGWNAGDWDAQPGMSPGRGALGEEGAYVPLRNAAITYWFFINSRRIIAVFKMGTSYMNMYLGLMNPFGTAVEYPYPLAVVGCSSIHNRLYSTAGLKCSGLCDPIASNSAAQGPALIRDTAGSWYTFQNGVENGSGTRTEAIDRVIWPCGRTNHTDYPAEDRAATGLWPMSKFTTNSGNPGTPTARIVPTPGAGGGTPLFPTMAIMTDPIKQLLGELDNVYWLSGVASPANIISEDTITIGGDTYVVFQNCNRTDYFALVAIKRE